MVAWIKWLPPQIIVPKLFSISFLCAPFSLSRLCYAHKKSGRQCACTNGPVPSSHIGSCLMQHSQQSRRVEGPDLQMGLVRNQTFQIRLDSLEVRSMVAVAVSVQGDILELLGKPGMDLPGIESVGVLLPGCPYLPYLGLLLKVPLGKICVGHTHWNK